MREIIIEKLNEIEEKENVTILYAAESGSRAWGFASSDSDYDVRFIYLRREADYLRLDQTSDVIQWQLDDVLDISGWDLKKTLQLLYKSNPTIFEWCSSPIVYMKKDTIIPFFRNPSSIFFSQEEHVSLLEHGQHSPTKILPRGGSGAKEILLCDANSFGNTVDLS